MMTEESFVDFKCPYCGEAIAFPKDSAGLAQGCPNCTESVVVPDDGSEVGRKVPIPITTPRLVLRRLIGTDWNDLMELHSDEELFRLHDGRPLGEAEIAQWLEADSYVKLTTPDHPLFLAIELKDSDKLIGYLSLSFTDQQRLQTLLTIVLSRPHQRKGLASEVVAAVLAFCFKAIGLHRVSAYCDSRHVAARQLLERAGLRREGEFLKDRFVNGEWVNTLWFAMLSEESSK
jgi:RimJ/RimL family protein N-acetyltransferase